MIAITFVATAFFFTTLLIVRHDNIHPGHMMRQFKRAIGLEANVLASNQDWLVAGVDNCLHLITPNPFFNFPVVKSMELEQRVKAIRFVDAKVFECQFATNQPASIFVNVNTWKIVDGDDARASGDDYTVDAQPRHRINLYKSGNLLVTVAYPLGKCRFTTVGYLNYPGDASSLLLYGYLPDMGELFVWRVMMESFEAILMMQAIGGPSFERCQIATIDGIDNVYFMVTSQKKQVSQVELFDTCQSWTGLVPNVSDVGTRNEVHVEAEDEFDL